MRASEGILSGYENTVLIKHSEITGDFPNTVAYDDLGCRALGGVLKANKYVGGRLMQTYTKAENHVLAIAATRLGKTTSCVIPQVLSFARQSVKRGMIISDPKGELYRLLSAELRKDGYDVLLLNLRDYKHSENWNPVLPIFRKYVRALKLEEEVEVVSTPEGLRNSFQGRIYSEQTELDGAIENVRSHLLKDVDGDIDRFMFALIPPDEAKDQYWNSSARQWGKALLWAMLEDVEPKEGREAITEETFSLNTMFSIAESLSGDRQYDDHHYFSGRGSDSEALKNAKCVIENADTTRQCIVSTFYSRVQAFRNCTVRLITGCSSFDMSRLTGEKPTAIFISYPDETKVYYSVISSFVQEAYTYLLNYANDRPDGKLEVPFYFILDEFGNFPRIADFDTVISACGGRNIWFYLVLQSYAQLDNVYGKNVAEIIRDNLNVHIFLGSNNPSTIEQFSKECGETSRISPKSALSGTKGEIEVFETETIPLIPRSLLAGLKPGECVVTEANCGYVMLSKMERYYDCPEFRDLELSSDKDYVGSADPLDRKYAYKISFEKKSGRGLFGL